MRELADVHCHLNFENFKKDLDDVVRRARVAGVLLIIDSGFDYISNERSIGISGMHDGILHSTLGFSPNRIGKSDYRFVVDQILEHQESIIGIGEVGIDLKKAKADYTLQKRIFLEFVSLAEELEKPLIVHARRAEEKVFNLIANRDVRVVFHCYTGNKALARKIADSGHYISLSTLVCFSKNVQEIASSLEPEHVLLETDSPFLSPDKGRNEPEKVRYAYKKLSEITGISVEELSSKLIKNVKEIFDVKL